MEYKGSPLLLAHLVSLGTLLISVYTLRSMGVDEFFFFFFLTPKCEWHTIWK